MKRIFLVLAVLCCAMAAVWAADFSTRDGDFLSFHLRESRDTTLARFNALVQKGDIWNEDIGQDGTLHFTARAAKAIYVGELIFEHKQLVRINLLQRDGYERSEKPALKSYIEKRLIRSISKTYGPPQTVFTFPKLSELTDEPCRLAEWNKWKNRIVVYLTREGKRYYARVVLEAVDQIDATVEEE